MKQRTQHHDGRLCTWNRSRILLVQNPLMTQQTCPTWIHIPRLRVVSVTSSLAYSNLQSALAEYQRGITVLKYIVVKKLSDCKPDDPRLGFCGFLKVEVVQQVTRTMSFNLVIRIKRRNKQQQRYQHTISTSMAHTATYSQASNSCQYSLSHTQMQASQQQMLHTFTHVPQALPQQQHVQLQNSTFNRHLLSHMHQLNSRSMDRLHSIECSHIHHMPVMSAPQQLMQQQRNSTT